MSLLVYLGIVVTPVPNDEIDWTTLCRRFRNATPADEQHVWCRWPDGALYKHFRAQLS